MRTEIGTGALSRGPLSGRLWLVGVAVLTPGLVFTMLVALAPATNGFDDLHVAGLEVSDDLSMATVTFSGDQEAVASGPAGTTRVTDHQLRVPLKLTDSTSAQTVTMSVRDRSVVGDLSIVYYPPTYYESIAANLNGVILLDTTLPRVGMAALGPGMDAQLTDADATTPAAPRWAQARAEGIAPTVSGSVPDAVASLYRQLNELNNPNVGQLCSEQASGIDTLLGLVNHQCWVWCTGNAMILRGFLRSAGIPARVVALSPQARTLPNGVLVQSSEGHGTVEWWDGMRWVWMGPTTRTLRVTGPEGTALSAQQLITALASPATRDGLSFTRLDAASGTWRTLPYDLEDAAFKDAVRRDFSSDKTLIGVGRPSEPPMIMLTSVLWGVVAASLATSLAAWIRRRRRARVSCRSDAGTAPRMPS